MGTALIQLFGRIQVSSGSDTAIRFGGAKRGALLAYLALSPSHPQPRDAVAAALWPDGDPDSNRHRLRQELSSLRRQLDESGIPSDSLIVATRNELHLHPDNAEVDVVSFRSAARRAHRTDDIQRKEQLLSEAAALYGGPFLAEYDLEWAQVVRETLAADLKRILEELAALRRDRGDLSGAAESLRSLLHVDPLHETAHIGLMRIHIDAGQPALAVQQYRELERTLQSELEVAPSRVAQELLEEIRAQSRSVLVNRSIVPSLESSAEDPAAHAIGLAITDRPAARTGDDRRRAARVRDILSLPGARYAAASTVLLAIGMALFLRLPRSSPRPTSPPALPSLPVLWQTQYHAQPGEVDDSEPASVTSDGEGGAYACGFTRTADKEDVDILTQRYSAGGRLQWSSRYSSPEHDADRAYSAIPHDGGVFVVGETYVPPGHGVPEGWRHVVLNYDRNGKPVWQSRHPDIIWEKDVRRIVGIPDGEGGVLVGGTIVRDGARVAMVARYSMLGRRLWTTTIRPDGTAKSWLRDVIVGPGGACLACGDADLPPTSKPAAQKGFVCRIDRVDGRKTWVKTLDGGHGGGNSFARLTCGPAGGIYAGGNFYGGDVAEGGTGRTLAVAQFYADGTLAWLRMHRAAGPAFGIRAMANNFAGNVFITGTRGAPDGGGEILTACYDLGGNRVWEQRSPLPRGMSGSSMGIALTETDLYTLTGLYRAPYQVSQLGWQVEAYSGRGQPLALTRNESPATSINIPLAISGERQGIFVASQTGSGERRVITLTKLAYHP